MSHRPQTRFLHSENALMHDYPMEEELGQGLYSFETSRIICPAEIIEHSKATIKKIDEVCNRLPHLNLSNAERYVKFINYFRDLLFMLEFPVDQKIFETSNDLATYEGRPALSWEEVRELYGVFRFGALEQALLNLRKDPNDETIQNLIIVLNQCKQDLLQTIDRFGGDLEERVARVTQNLSLTDERRGHVVEAKRTNVKGLLSSCNWHPTILGKKEEDAFIEIITMLRKRYGFGDFSKLKFAEFGVGDGRMAELLDRLYDTPADSHGRRHGLYIPNFIGIEYAESNLRNARERIRKLLEKRDLPHLFKPEQIVHGNFLEQPLLIKPGSVHFAFSMMRTTFHCITETQLAKFLEGVSIALAPGNKKRPGGVFLMDSVRRRPLHNVSEKEKASLEDLMDLYHQLARMYAERYQKFMPAGIDLKRNACAPEEDNTAGNKIESSAGFYPREIMTIPYLEHVIHKYKLDFTVSQVGAYKPPLKDNKKRDQAIVKLGRKWIKDNLLDDYYRQEIERRLAIPGGIHEDTLYMAGNTVESIIDYVAYNMVYSYPSIYIMLEKVSEEPFNETKKGKS